MGADQSSPIEDVVVPPLSRADLDDLLRHTHYAEDEILQLRHQFLADILSVHRYEGTHAVVQQQQQASTSRSTYLKKQKEDESIPYELFERTLFFLGIRQEILVHMLFRAFDRDADGLISFFEFARGMSLMTRGTNAERIQFAFDMYDVERRGELRRDTVLPLLEAMEQFAGTSFRTYSGAFSQGGSGSSSSIGKREWRAGELTQELFRDTPILSRDAFREVATRNPAIVRGLALQ